jgi:hypothetical protein
MNDYVRYILYRNHARCQFISTYIGGLKRPSLCSLRDRILGRNALSFITWLPSPYSLSSW